MIGNVYRAFGQHLENLLKVVGNLWKIVKNVLKLVCLCVMGILYIYKKTKSCRHRHSGEITAATLEVGLVAIKQ